VIILTPCNAEVLETFGRRTLEDQTGNYQNLNISPLPTTAENGELLPRNFLWPLAVKGQFLKGSKGGYRIGSLLLNPCKLKYLIAESGAIGI